MIFFYIGLNIFLYYIGKTIFKQKINPISIYSFIWVLSVSAYEMKLVRYYDLNFITWIVIISFQLAYVLGCLFGQARYKKYDYHSKTNLYYINGDSKVWTKKIEKKLKNIIILLSFISAFAIIPNFLGLVNQYGIHILSSTNHIYHDRLTGGRSFEIIPYLGSIVHMAVILSGIYISRFHARSFLIIPTILMILNMLPTGGRTDFILGFLYLLLPSLLNRRNYVNISKKQKLVITSLLLTFGAFFAVITNNRSAWIKINSYMSPVMVRLVNINPSIYKLYNYFAGPIGVLNIYLKYPVYNFGINSFGFIISFLNKFGAGLNYQRYQDFYCIPVLFNVGTYIRELIQDFRYVGGILAIVIFGFLYGKCFAISKRKQSFTSEIYVVIFSTIIFMSFFVWFYRETVFWISTFLGLPVGFYLDWYSNKETERYLKTKDLKNDFGFVK